MGQYHSPQKKSLEDSTHDFSFEIHLPFFIFCDVFILTQIYFICSETYKCLLEFLFKEISLILKLMQYT
jgi:hypothetical protein